jgi:hypothetical protein
VSARPDRRRERSDLDVIFGELSDLLDLSASAQGYRSAFLAQSRRPGSLCCSCSCCCEAVL